MKKILCLILMVMFLAVGTVSADYVRGSTGDQLITYTVYGVDEAVALTTIPTGTRVLGFMVAGNGASGFAGLYDCASLLVATSSNLVAEGSAASSQSSSVWFPMPYKVKTRLVIVTDASTTSVTVFYE